MSVTAAEAFAAVKSRLGSGISFTLYWQGEDAPILEDDPTAFGYVVFDNEGSNGSPVAFGGGAGANIYRNRARVEAYVFSPMGEGASVALGYAEQVAARLRSYRDASISCFSADVILIGPGTAISLPQVGSAVNNYQCAVAEISLFFDQIG